MSTVYHYHPVTGELQGASQLLIDPSDETRALLPAHATTIAPPKKTPRGTVARFVETAQEWQQQRRHTEGVTTAPSAEPSLAEAVVACFMDFSAKERAPMLLLFAKLYAAASVFGLGDLAQAVEGIAPTTPAEVVVKARLQAVITGVTNA
jgi:hypothetical protein